MTRMNKKWHLIANLSRIIRRLFFFSLGLKSAILSREITKKNAISTVTRQQRIIILDVRVNESEN